jgi:hypothetical protein
MRPSPCVVLIEAESGNPASRGEALREGVARDFQVEGPDLAMALEFVLLRGAEERGPRAAFERCVGAMLQDAQIAAVDELQVIAVLVEPRDVLPVALDALFRTAGCRSWRPHRTSPSRMKPR